MHVTRRTFGLGTISFLALAAGSPAARAQSDGPIMNLVESAEEFGIAVDAYIYGYPLVTMEMTRRIVSNVAKPEGTRAPMGTLIKLREYPNASFRDVTAPNADTLYTTAFFDVGDEPWVLAQPDMGDRYFLLPLLSGWTDVFEVPGKRTTGGAAKTFLITGPGWKGTVPEGMVELKSPTASSGCWAASTAPERRRTMRPFMPCRTPSSSSRSAPGARTTRRPQARSIPAIDMKTSTRDQVNALVDDGLLHAARGAHEAQPAGRRRRAARWSALPRSAWCPARTSTRAFSIAEWDRRVPEVAYDRIMLHFIDSDGDMTAARTAGPTRPRPGSTAPTTSSGRW